MVAGYSDLLLDMGQALLSRGIHSSRFGDHCLCCRCSWGSFLGLVVHRAAGSRHNFVVAAVAAPVVAVVVVVAVVGHFTQNIPISIRSQSLLPTPSPLSNLPILSKRKRKPSSHPFIHQQSPQESKEHLKNLPHTRRIPRLNSLLPRTTLPLPQELPNPLPHLGFHLD